MTARRSAPITDSRASGEHPAAEFRRLRIALGLKQREVARLLGFSTIHVYMREAGKTKVRPAELMMLRHMAEERKDSA